MRADRRDKGERLEAEWWERDWLGKGTTSCREENRVGWEGKTGLGQGQAGGGWKWCWVWGE